MTTTETTTTKGQLSLVRETLIDQKRIRNYTANACLFMTLETKTTKMANLVKVNISAAVKGYHDCRFTVNIRERFNVHVKMGERGRAFKVSNGRGQLGISRKNLFKYSGK